MKTDNLNHNDCTAKKNAKDSKDAHPAISIFIPVFNGENFLAETITSIKAQFFGNYEVIFIDDHSTDNSLELLQKQTYDDKRFRILKTPSNLGDAAKVLKYGFKYVRGTYFVYSSQDDLFSKDWLSSMYQRAVETNADATIPDLVFYDPSTQSKNSQLIGLNGNKSAILDPREAFIHSLNWTIPGNALWKTSLIKKVGWYDFSMNADEYSVRVFFLNSNYVVFSSGIFYYRQNNPNAITKKLTLKSFETPFTTLRLWLLAKHYNFDLDVQGSLLNSSIGQLMYLAPLAYGGKFRSACPLIKSVFCSLQENDVSKWLKINDTMSLRSFANRLALQSYSLFLMISFLKLAARKTLRQK